MTNRIRKIVEGDPVRNRDIVVGRQQFYHCIPIAVIDFLHSLHIIDNEKVMVKGQGETVMKISAVNSEWQKAIRRKE